MNSRFWRGRWTDNYLFTSRSRRHTFREYNILKCAEMDAALDDLGYEMCTFREISGTTDE